MKTGDIKMIYTDPCRETLPEGKAYLLYPVYNQRLGVHYLKNVGWVEMWMVKMVETGKAGQRLILNKEEK